MENKPFTYQYSAEKNREVEAIRKKYLPHQQSKIERLKKLDGRVQRAGWTEGLSIGVIGALIFGLGMCFYLEVFAGAAWLTALLMVLGVLLMIPAYPIYRYVSRKAKARLTPEILRLSEEIMHS